VLQPLDVAQDRKSSAPAVLLSLYKLVQDLRLQEV
jgi:hypothetical protein